ncbi:MAG: DPP IV N-terminal domain-containing protein [Muribaculaceae bacterium]|nr:DPP IV N-terminal domain-containing protein [Muribaculaceae bacterium]
MKLKYIIAIGMVATTMTTWAAIGAQRSKAVSELAPYCYPANKAASADIVFMPDGKSYVERSDDSRSLVIKDIESGKEGDVIFDVTHTRETNLSDFEGFMLSPDASKIIVWRNKQMVYRRSFTAEFYVYEVRSRLLKPLSTQHKRQSVPVFSPDSRMVAFVADNNIYVAKLDYGTEVAVTTDGDYGKIINGATDWTYEEEFGVTSLMTWAPDNLTLCYVRFDESEVPLYSMPIYAGTCSAQEQYEYYPGIMSYKYSVAGSPNSVVSVHSYDVETRKTKQIDLPTGAGYYIPRIEYGPKESMLMIATLNRDQNHFELFMSNPKSTVTRSIYTEEAKAWIETEAYSTLSFSDNSFVVASNVDGFTRYYEYSYSGAKLRDITMEGCDAIDYYGSDNAGNHYYCAASPRPLDRTIYRLDRKGVVKAISPEAGTSTAVFSPGCTAMLLEHSSVTEVPTYSLCKTDGKTLRTIVDNKAYADNVSSLKAVKEFVTVKSEGGVELNAYIVKPRDFNPSHRYPVIMSQYSGPGSQQVLDKWTLDWEDYYALKGYIVISVDGRGTGGRGAAFRNIVYKNLGYYETIDQIAGARYATSLPYVNVQKIGIYGWSYGGYQALMCATVDDSPYAAAVAVAPVTDWRYYDTVYTERYMLTPQQNDKGYNTSSAVLRALHLSCPLLLMYGTADDNVHPANTLQFVSTLQSAGILCDMFVFPQMNHSINGCNARAVVYGRMFEFFESKLK